MNKYAKSALIAYGYLSRKEFLDPELAWQKAVESVFENSPSSQKKGCPKGAFLGLCSEGLVKGIALGNYTRSQDNKAYAVSALEKLKHMANLPTANELWALVVGNGKVHNQQMNVVLALYANNVLI